MYALIGALLFFAIAIMTTLVACGLPLGEFTMGGQYKVLPPKYRVAAVASIVIQLFAMVIILQAGGLLTFLFSAETTQYICFFFAAYLSFNTILNFLSKSKKERNVMTPLALAASICYWVTAFQMQLS